MHIRLYRELFEALTSLHFSILSDSRRNTRSDGSFQTKDRRARSSLAMTERKKQRHWEAEITNVAICSWFVIWSFSFSPRIHEYFFKSLCAGKLPSPQRGNFYMSYYLVLLEIVRHHELVSEPARKLIRRSIMLDAEINSAWRSEERGFFPLWRAYLSSTFDIVILVS